MQYFMHVTKGIELDVKALLLHIDKSKIFGLLKYIYIYIHTGIYNNFFGVKIDNYVYEGPSS